MSRSSTESTSGSLGMDRIALGLRDGSKIRNSHEFFVFRNHERKETGGDKMTIEAWSARTLSGQKKVHQEKRKTTNKTYYLSDLGRVLMLSLV
jgi:hypothetical protein